MNTLQPQTALTLKPVSLDEKYVAVSGEIFLTGVQALVRLPLMQKRRDQAAGLYTAGYISGYRGSPLGTYDDQLTKAKKLLSASHIVFQPGVNEDLAATAVWGSQQSEARGEGKYDGVFAIWYGKGPGVDRSGDAFRHANLAGSSAKGGVLVLMGDDHTCESSTTCHQSEFALVDAMIPVLSPAGVQEILDFGLMGWAMSRYSGLWVGIKCVKDVADATAVVSIDESGLSITEPDKSSFPPDGLNLRQPDTPHAQEYRLHNYKLDAAKSFALVNKLDRIQIDPENAWLGIATHGKSYLDVLQAFDDLELSETELKNFGVRILKLGMVWPLEPTTSITFAKGLERILVVEEKRSLVEQQLKDILFNTEHRPLILGKKDEAGRKLFQAEMALNSVKIALAIGRQLVSRIPNEKIEGRLAVLEKLVASRDVTEVIQRGFYFCSGCPHSSSTKLPEGSRGYAGIGCSWMAQSMERSTLGYTQMGAEGMSWVGEAPFSQTAHVFQNLGDGTYFHSGLLAIRAAVAAGTNITYKILFNDAVAMTGGQTHDGNLTPQSISWQVFAEGVSRIAVVSDDPGKYKGRYQPTAAPGLVDPAPISQPIDALKVFAPQVTIHHRDELNKVQSTLRSVRGTTVLIYDQTCAAEKRRRRKRGLMVDPPKRLFINPDVCEGCGDCGTQSNCVSLVPLETELGRKRAIDQSSCNKDYSCVKGFCPSFVTVLGGELKKPQASDVPYALETIPEPQLPTLEKTYSLVITGIGGTGVVTVGAILGMAAHIEGKGCGILDMAGLAQKGGSVWSHLRISAHPSGVKAIRVAPGGADAFIGCDIVVTASEKSLQLMNPGVTRVAVNTHGVMPGHFTRNPDMEFPGRQLKNNIESIAKQSSVFAVDANKAALALLGDSIATNMFMVGYAYQCGLVPLSATAIEKAIEINGTAVKLNRKAFGLGRFAAAEPLKFSELLVGDKKPVVVSQDLDEVVQTRREQLLAYQDKAYSDRYLGLVSRVRDFEAASFGRSTRLTEAVARNYAKLLAYKDEYEVARLYSDTGFLKNLLAGYQGKVKLKFNLAPPLLARKDLSTGLPRKSEFGSWMLVVFNVLSKMRGLRGTPFDVFGYTEERKMERSLIEKYEKSVDLILAKVNGLNFNMALQLASLPTKVRGFGHVKKRSADEVLAEWVKLEDALSRAVIPIGTT